MEYLGYIFCALSIFLLGFYVGGCIMGESIVKIIKEITDKNNRES